MSRIAQLKELLGEIADLNAAAAVLSWDQNTYMPPGGAEARGHQLATLSKLAHLKFTSPEVGKLIEEAQKEDLDPESDDAALVRVTARDYEKATRVPPEFVAEVAMVTSRAHEAWVEAKGKSDFSIFRPHLERIVELTQQYVTFFPPADHPYDTLLDNYEPGMKTAEVKEIFDQLRPQQVELIRAITSRPQVEDGFLRLDYEEQKQWDFGVEVITKFGYDWKRGRQDKSPPPLHHQLQHQRRTHHHPLPPQRWRLSALQHHA